MTSEIGAPLSIRDLIVVTITHWDAHAIVERLVMFRFFLHELAHLGLDNLRKLVRAFRALVRILRKR